MSRFKMMKACVVFLLWATAAVALPAQTFTTLVNFDEANGYSPTNISLVQGIDGNFYGTTVYGGAEDFGTVFKVTPGGTVTTIHSFCSQANCIDGDLPSEGLVLGTDGNFYGTTVAGGANMNCDAVGDGCGTVFKITPSVNTAPPIAQGKSDVKNKIKQNVCFRGRHAFCSANAISLNLAASAPRSTQAQKQPSAQLSPAQMLPKCLLAK
jgi:uncharacterized repeat protein (TIGR03803 family)